MSLAQDLVQVIIASRPSSWSFGPILFSIGVINSRKIPLSFFEVTLAAFSPFPFHFVSVSVWLDSALTFYYLQLFLEWMMCTIIQQIAVTLEKFLISSKEGSSSRNTTPSSVFPLAYPLSLYLEFHSSLVGSIIPLRSHACCSSVGSIPVIDSMPNGLIVFLVWFCGFSFSQLTLDKVLQKGLVLSLCTSGIHALGAMVDASADVAAGQRTIATALGQRPAAIFSCIWWHSSVFYALTFLVYWQQRPKNPTQWLASIFERERSSCWCPV